MVCSCGFNNAPDSKICMRCEKELVATTGSGDTSYSSSYMNTSYDTVQPAQTKQKKKSRAWVVILALFALFALLAMLLVGIAVIFLGIWGVPKLMLASHISNAEKYVTAGDYESAVSEYDEAIKLDSKKNEAYIGMAEAYFGMANAEPDDDTACTYLEKAKTALEQIGEGADEDSVRELNKGIEDSLYERTIIDVWLISANRYYYNGNISSTTRYDYDDMGNEIAYSSYYYSTNKSYDGEYEYEYDNEGRVVTKTFYSSGKYSYAWGYKYDADGNMTQSYGRDEYGNVTWRNEYEYDNFGNQIKYASYTDGGTLSYETDHLYDDHGNVIETSSYELNEDNFLEMISKSKYEYDGNDNQIRSISYYYPEGDSYIFEQDYDDEGNVTETRNYGTDGMLSRTSRYTYDGNGNQISVKYYTEENNLLSERFYEYDSQGKQTKDVYIDYYVYPDDTYNYSNGDTSTTYYAYDSNGNLIRTEYTSDYTDYPSISENEYIKLRLSQKQADARLQTEYY